MESTSHLQKHDNTNRNRTKMNSFFSCNGGGGFKREQETLPSRRKGHVHLIAQVFTCLDLIGRYQRKMSLPKVRSFRFPSTLMKPLAKDWNAGCDRVTYRGHRARPRIALGIILLNLISAARRQAMTTLTPSLAHQNAIVHSLHQP